MTEYINKFKKKDFLALANEIEDREWYDCKVHDGLYIQVRSDDKGNLLGWVIGINNGDYDQTLLFTDKGKIRLFKAIDTAVLFLSDNLPEIFDDIRVCYR
jgi:hypothetical protein